MNSMTPSTFRRVVPNGYTVCVLRLDGETPLLMSSGEADRQSETYRAYRVLSKKRGKTIDDEERLSELEWYTRLYWDDEIGAYIPGKNIKELLRSAATKWKRGEDVRRSLIVSEYRIALGHNGPDTAQGLYDAGFSYISMVANAGAGSGRVERTRPCFDEWALEVEIAFDPEDLDFDDVALFVERSEKYGLGDYRPEFGSFSASLTKKNVSRRPSRSNGSKPRDAKAERATKAIAKKLTTAR